MEADGLSTFITSLSGGEEKNTTGLSPASTETILGSGSKSLPIRRRYDGARKKPNV